MKLSKMPKDDVKAGIKLKTEDGKTGTIGCVVFGNELNEKPAQSRSFRGGSSGR